MRFKCFLRRLLIADKHPYLADWPKATTDYRILAYRV